MSILYSFIGYARIYLQIFNFRIQTNSITIISMSQNSENYPEEYKNWSLQFFGRKFVVTPNVLIPRLETECLIKRARTFIQKEQIKTVIDIGSGSWIIGTCIADIVDEVIFIDISSEALLITEKNFTENFPEKKSRYIQSDLLSQLSPADFSSLRGPILFLTNLPYIRDEDWKNMSKDTHFEPKIALFGGEKTGFELYEKLFEQFEILCMLESLDSLYCIFEFGFDQRKIAEETLKKYKDWNYSFFPDYAGIERFWEISFEQNP